MQNLAKWHLKWKINTPGAFERCNQTPQRGASFFKMVQVAKLGETGKRKSKLNYEEKSTFSKVYYYTEKTGVSTTPRLKLLFSRNCVSIPNPFLSEFVWTGTYMFEYCLLCLYFLCVFHVYFVASGVFAFFILLTCTPCYVICMWPGLVALEASRCASFVGTNK